MWAAAPSETERTKCDNAVNVVRKALAASTALSRRNVRVFAQGSYCNRTNVRQDSDVDVCALCSDTMFYDLPPGFTANNFSINPATYSYHDYKNEISAALNAYFDHSHVVRGNKAFDIKENTYRIAADVVPCFVYKEFAPNGSTIEGVAFQPDIGLRIVNWPDQNYANGVTKNTASGQRFKGMARILKRLRYKMKDENIAAAEPIPSFLLECLAYNLPNDALQLDTYSAAVRDAVIIIYNATKDPQTCSHWYEVNERKLLFGGNQPWTFQQVNGFMLAAWSYLGFT